MKIKKITSQNRRDFHALYECESCGATEEGSGYDDSHFHTNIIPDMICKKCEEPECEFAGRSKKEVKR